MRILIADDHAFVRRGLKDFLTDEFTDAIVEEANDGVELIRKARLETWDIIITDISMPEKSGLEALKQLKEEFPKIPVLVLSMYPEDQYAIRVLRSGASGYLNKEIAPDELINAVRRILSGEIYISQAVTEKLAQTIRNDFSVAHHEILSDREFEVFKLIASGKSVAEIAKHLSLSGTTISTFRIRILKKMRLQTNAELAQYAIQHNIF